ncbi:MAG: hypothetical protein AB1715_09575 [Acidobacteriota bacterium]
MTRRVRLCSILLLLFWMGCGKKGPLQLPLARRPQVVQDLSLVQRGKALFLTWTNPTAYLDGSPLREVAECEIWVIGEDRAEGSPVKKWTAAEFEVKARLLEAVGRDKFASLRQKEVPDSTLVYVYSPASADLGRKILTFSLRVKDEKKRASEFADPLSLEVAAPPPPPQDVRAFVLETHIHLRWEPSSGAGSYNIYRAEDKGSGSLLNSSPVKSPEYLDRNFSFGASYRYHVRAIAESEPGVESEDSAVAEVIPRDSFPPAPPKGLTAIAAEGFIALSWEANTERDLAGYGVWRREAGKGEFTLLTSLPATVSSFSDQAVEKNRRYEYAITALDSAGNESPQSNPVSGIMRDYPL